MSHDGVYGDLKVLKSVQSTLSYLKSTSVPRVAFTYFLVEHGLIKYYYKIQQKISPPVTE